MIQNIKSIINHENKSIIYIHKKQKVSSCQYYVTYTPDDWTEAKSPLEYHVHT